MEKIKDTITGKQINQPECKSCKENVGSEWICICRDCVKKNIKHDDFCKCNKK